MDRTHNTDKNGNNWSESQIIAVWNKGKIIPNYSSDIWRWDICGLVMKFSEYGNRQSKHGWEIDHINPVANGGDDDLNNLQPLNWKNNLEKADKLDWDY